MAQELSPDLAVLQSVLQTPSAKPAVESEGATVYANPANDPDQSAQSALASAVQTPSAQPASTIPRSALGSNNTPGIIRLIAGIISPQTQQMEGQLRPPSRMATFENFLSNFVGALGQGLANQGT